MLFPGALSAPESVEHQIQEFRVHFMFAVCVE
jgi:hypothetical protein